VTDLSEVGAFPTTLPNGAASVRFGVYLPGISPDEGYGVKVRIIHRDDRFNPQISPRDFDLSCQAGHQLNLWSCTIPIAPVANTSFGTPGTYLYRYQLVQSRLTGSPPTVVTLWFTDPFARATDVGELCAFATPDVDTAFVWTDAQWKTPDLDDLVVYELHVEEFNSTFDGVVERLAYLKSLGVNTLELMPVTSVKLDFDWGYGPLHYFAPNARWGGSRGLKNLINECHNNQMAVILDVVYQHVDPAFPYSLVYVNAGKPSPMIGPNGPFGPTIDFSQQFAQDYVAAANRHWLDEYHVDGFRYDEVTDLFTSPTDTAYAKLAYDTYNLSLGISRFQRTPSEYSRIIQVAEALGKSRAVLCGTFTSAVWQDELLNEAEDLALRGSRVDDSFVHLLDPRFVGYPDTKMVRDARGSPVDMPVAPFQYVETHDHSQLIAFVEGDPDGPAFTDRERFYKTQPFAIALYTCQGVPMLWQGQEIAESWTLPSGGPARIGLRRDVHWERFYDAAGSTLVNLYRRLGALRRGHRSLRSRESYYYYHESDTTRGVVAYHRRAAADATQPEEVAMVLLNFSDGPATLSVPFPSVGIYRELLDDPFRLAEGKVSLEVRVAGPGEVHPVFVPSNYGQIFMTT
jgi:maltooligosyltrehalose trehalohydrolase